jgi:hypothetical protein
VISLLPEHVSEYPRRRWRMTAAHFLKTVYPATTAQSILMTLLVTLRQNGRDALEFLSRQLQSQHLIALPRVAG